MANYEGINHKVIQYSQLEREVINKRFEEELKKATHKFIEDEFMADGYSEVVLDEMYRNHTEIHEIPNGENIEEEFEWYEDDDGDLWYYEIPETITPDRKPFVINTKPEDKTFLQLFLGDENYKAFMSQTQ